MEGKVIYMSKTGYDFKSARCMLCGNIGLTFVNRLRDNDDHWAASCNNCRHVQLTPLPTIEEEEQYYQTNELYSISQMEETQLVRKLEQLIEFQFGIFNDLVPSPAEVIEIGSGYGLFLKKAKNEGYNVAGIELNNDKRAYCESISRIKAYNFNLIFDDIPAEISGKYDAMAMFFLLEHILNPIEFLRRSGKLLKKNGKVIILVPNLDSFMENCKEYNDFHYFRPHLSYFSSKILSKVLDEAGFTDIKVIGRQQYSVENAIHWARNKAPFLDYAQIKMPESLEFVNEFYKKKKEMELKSDMLVATGIWN